MSSSIEGRRLLMEVCVDSVESAMTAVRGGADRLELCGNLGLGGGTTPSLGLLKSVQRAVPGIPIMAMVRPRTGDFLYTGPELEIMIEDIWAFKAHNVAGVVLGVLKPDGTVDVDSTKLLVQEALPLQVTFHRAFDMTASAQLALNDILGIDGITRILTSGHEESAPSAIPELSDLLSQTTASIVDADKASTYKKVVILPGSGINPRTVANLCNQLLPYGLQEVHLSGGEWIDSSMTFRREGFGMGVGGVGEWGIWRTGEATICEVRRAMDASLLKICMADVF